MTYCCSKAGLFLTAAPGQFAAPHAAPIYKINKTRCTNKLKILTYVSGAFFSMAAPRPSRRPQAGGSTFAAVASSTTAENLDDFKMPAVQFGS